MDSSFLDPENTMDYALFKKVRARFMFHTVSHKSMLKVVQLLVDQRIYEDDLMLPPLDVILHKDLVEPAWGWDRLLPWMTGFCLFEDYFEYLGDYFSKNLADAEKCRDFRYAAKMCIEAEDALIDAMRKHDGLGNIFKMSITSTREHEILSKQIKSEADRIMTLGSASTVLAAGLMCIMEEANLMCEVLTRNIKDSDQSTMELCQMKFEFGYDVRKAALDILTKYKGPYCDEVSASLLGMQKEAIVARKLLNQEYLAEPLVLSEEIRNNLLKLLIIIRDRFPMDRRIEYPHKIGRARAAVKDRLKDLHLIERGVIHGNADVVNSSGISQTPITAIAHILSWSLHDNNESETERKNKKRKIMGGTQDSGTPIMQSSQLRKDS